MSLILIMREKKHYKKYKIYGGEHGRGKERN